MTKTNPSRKLKKITAFFAAVLMCISCLCMSASAASYKSYAFQTNSTGSGDNKWMDAGKVEYTRILVSCGTSSAKGTLQLWKKWWLGDVHYPDNQTVTVGPGRRAWWFVDSGNSGEYHVTAIASDNLSETMSFAGVFQNF